HNDVIPFCDALLIKLSQLNWRRQQVAVIGNLEERHGMPIGVSNRDLEEARYAGVQDAEAILAALHLEVRVVSQVHGHYIAQEPVKLENVHEQLAGAVECFFSQHQVNVIFQVAPALGSAGGQAEVDAVIDAFVTAIKGAVNVEHGSIALVHVLRSEREHVIVEPVRGHGFMPVARDLVTSTCVVRGGSFGIGGGGVDFKNTGQNDRPVIIVELVGEEERAGKAVVFRTVVAIVLVGGNGVPSEAVVLVHISGKPVVMTEQNGLHVAALDQLWRNSSIERPYRVRRLCGEARMELQRNRSGRIDAAVELRINCWVIDGIGLRLCLCDFHRDSRRELSELLVRPDWPRRTALDRTSQAGLSANQGWIQWLLSLVGFGRWDRGEIATQWIGATRNHIKPRHGRAEGQYAKPWARRCAGGDATTTVSMHTGNEGA